MFTGFGRSIFGFRSVSLQRRPLDTEAGRVIRCQAPACDTEDFSDDLMADVA
jgi:hypothetical protein